MSDTIDLDAISERLKSSYNNQFVCDHTTSMVVEGFPRSSNTFTVDFLFMLSQRGGQNMKLAHHTHDAENDLLGHGLKIPCVVLLRSPVAAISSYMIYSGVDATTAVSRYIQFYKAVRPIKNKVLIAPFETLTTDFNAFVSAVNARFVFNIPLSEDLKADEETAKNMERERGARIYGEEHYASRVAVPNDERKAMAKSVKEEVSKMLENRPQAINLYNLLSGQA